MLTRNKPLSGSVIDIRTKYGQKFSPDKCRICLSDGEIPIFGANDISNDVTEFGQILIRKDDNLPQYLCGECHKLLEAATLFRDTAKLSDEILRRPDIDSGSEESDYKDEPYIKKEYLEFNYYTSDSETEFNFEKRKYDSESSSYNPTASIANSEDSNISNQTYLLHVKQEEDESVTEADSETIMIIVSDKDKQKLQQNKDDDSNSDSDEKFTENEKPLGKALLHQRECEVCHSIMPKSAYEKHLKIHREKYKKRYEKLYGKIECEYCGKLISKSYIKIHMKMHGTPEEKAERLMDCTICNKTFNINYYKSHVLKMHPTKSDTKQIEKRKESPTPATYYNICPVCDRDVKESEFKLHLEKHNGPLRRYICDKCGRVFKHPHAFKTHYLTHGSELKFKCQFCPYRGLHEALLKIHVRTHTGDYNYKCTECPAKFITKSNLSKHLMRHKQLYSFKCGACNKGFYTKRDLEKHEEMSHTMKVKSHICEVCGKAFGHRDNLLSHQLKVHKREVIARGRIPSYMKADLRNLE